MPPQLLLFAFATLTPAALVAAAGLAGGVWVTLALGYLLVFVALLDRIITQLTPATQGTEFPATNTLSAALGALHFPLLALTIWALATQPFGPFEKAGLFTAAGLFFGQVSNANAHELIHRPHRGLRKLGQWVYISLLFGHHTSAHPLVHHVHVATRADPSSARLGETYYRFAARAWRGSFRKGWQAESRRAAHIGQPWHRHPYLTYAAGSLICIVVAALLAGPMGLAAYLGLALMAQSQLLMSDYVQHYGLTRAIINGKPEPTGPAHSWNSPHVMSSALTMNAPRHSDHHMRPDKAYHALALPAAAPTLPRSLPTMAFIALIPPLWARIMDPRAQSWQNRASPSNVTQT